LFNFFLLILRPLFAKSFCEAFFINPKTGFAYTSDYWITANAKHIRKIYNKDLNITPSHSFRRTLFSLREFTDQQHKLICEIYNVKYQTGHNYYDRNLRLPEAQTLQRQVNFPVENNEIVSTNLARVSAQIEHAFPNCLSSQSTTLQTQIPKRIRIIYSERSNEFEIFTQRIMTFKNSYPIENFFYYLWCSNSKTLELNDCRKQLWCVNTYDSDENNCNEDSYDSNNENDNDFHTNTYETMIIQNPIVRTPVIIIDDSDDSDDTHNDDFEEDEQSLNVPLDQDINHRVLPLKRRRPSVFDD
jgi:hypothetical protein